MRLCSLRGLAIWEICDSLIRKTYVLVLFYLFLWIPYNGLHSFCRYIPRWDLSPTTCIVLDELF
ncbi:hypothetical protein BDV29DRAFT_168047 [Aspergillus leporis]|uniref:Uncharacterized protein n=1 Tax=Aspergillus leporis TaxID=41062 RepID=A0A5N5XEI4_9EURO|nr:hypothetical protein BDV29DRAFT_168047 [Aspergillus leporis]